MVPTPQEQTSAMGPTKLEDSIVISGMSGTFPKCLNLKEFSDVLYSKTDPLVGLKGRWKFDHPELPDQVGRIPDADQFDAQFFKINSQLAAYMDPMSRKLVEHSYRAIYDSGISPDCVSGRNIGVYIASCAAENDKSFFYDIVKINPSSMIGCSKGMFSNRISYCLNVRGPSFTLDAACAGSLTALEQAVLAMRRGDCDAAIVGASNMSLHPQSVIHMGRMFHLCMDGKTKSYDECADGCVKSEAVNVVFLQKAQDALRIYAEVVHIKSGLYGTKKQKGFICDTRDMADFVENFYKEANVDPLEVTCVEGFGCANSDKDKAELEAFQEVFCKGRDPSNSLLVGSVMSNIGYVESASGLSSVIKVLLGYKTGVLASNLHCSNPRSDVTALRDGRMRILTDHAPFDRTYAAVNGFSVTGVYGHLLLKGCYIPKKPQVKSSIPYLVTISGRQEAAVQSIIDDLSARPLDVEEVTFLHNIHEERNVGHLGRGYAIFDSTEEGTVCLSKNMHHFDDVTRPLWFMYSGMGSQWAGMGAQLMRIPIFATAIKKCHEVLKPKGLDLIHILTAPDKTIYDNILHSFVGIAAVQIGLTDVLTEMGVVPDNIIGHSVGELGCAYADGCLSAEEMILCAYSRGRVSLETELIRGSMAAVGIGYQKIKNLCPPEIEVACHNGPESCTISGPEVPMREFVAKLTAQGIFAKEVPCSNIAYHSRYIAPAGDGLLKYLTQVIPNPKRRSERWVSSSIPQERWGEENAQLCSAWYHTNNLLSSVLFEETSRLIPAGAVVVEVAPHGLLQAIVKRSLHPDCRHIPLTKRGHEDNARHLLEAIGKLYMEGYNPQIKNIYPPIKLPVSTDTPMMSHLPMFNEAKWPMPLLKPVVKYPTSLYNLNISIHDGENKYLLGHAMRGKTLYPFSAALVAVWDTFAMVTGVARSEMSVQFREVHLLAQPVLLDRRHLELNVTVHKGTGEFEVTNNGSQVATGFISQISEELPQYEITKTEKNLGSDAIYKLLQERDYSYTGDFCSIYRSNYSFMEADLLWNENWVTLLDGMLQLNSMRRQHVSVSQPSHIHKIFIDVKTHHNYEQSVNGKTVIPTISSSVFDKIRCGGILMEKVRFYDLTPLPTDTLELQSLVPRGPFNSVNTNDLKKGKYVPWKENVAIIRGVTLQSGNIGDLNSLSWVEAEAMCPATSDFVVTVRFAGLNLYDLNVATGVFSSKRGYLNKNVYGMDYSGTTNTGDHVMGIVRGGAASSRVRAVPELMWPVPAQWTLEDAATVPLAYSQAFYCLGIKAQLAPGMTIFIHGGTGALGQAAISIALANKCKVFTTVSDDRKKKFLLKQFPALTEDVIGCSRDHTFADMVLKATNGEGCDIVITSAPKELKNTTLNCGSYCGIILDVVQAHYEDSYAYGMNYMTKQRAYAMVDFFRVFEDPEIAKTLRCMISEGIARGYVRPLSRVTFGAHEASRAFRLLAASRHRGRVLLRLRDSIIPAQPRFSCSPDLNQVVVCREESLSLQFIDKLINCGARKLIIHQSQPSSLSMYKNEIWKNMGVDVKITTIDLNNTNKVQELFKNSDFETEGVYTICLGTNDDFKIVSNLKNVTNTLCPQLKHFAMINTSLDDNLCQSLTQVTLPPTMLSLGMIMNTNAINSVSRSGIMDIIECALCSNQQVIKVGIRQNCGSVLLKEIADKADIRKLGNVSDNTTLRELGLSNRYTSIVQLILQYYYHMAIPEDEIPLLTIKSLKEIENRLKEPDFEEPNDIGAFFSYIGEDELLQSVDLVILPTLMRSLTVNDDDIDPSKQYLWIVPGLEGHNEKFRTFCKQLKISAAVLQPGTDHLHETLEETAERYFKILSKNMKPEKYTDFYLLGYEAGVLSAIELACLLEKKGLTGTVFCVGGGPEEILAAIKSKLDHLKDDDELQNHVIEHMINLMSSERLENIDCVKNCATWDKKLENLRPLLKNVKHTSPFVRSVIEAAYARIKQTLNYKTRAYNLKSQVILLRPHTPTKACNGNILSQKPVSIHDCKVSLKYAMQYPLCASIVNENISPSIIEQYKSQNLCEAIPPDSDIFEMKLDQDA